jgi:hypothetical protein
MNQILWWLANAFSETLEPAEREAVSGDLAESGETGAQALHDVLGLVVRRQQQLWTHQAAPWFTLLGLIIPLGMLLSILSWTKAGEGAVYTWLYANNSDWALVRNRGFWYVLAGSAGDAVLGCLKLSCWSWTAGFVLGWVSRPRSVRLNSILLCLVLVFGALLGSPVYFEYMSRTFAPPNVADPGNSVNALRFYHAVFPVIVQATLVAVPALWAAEEASLARRMRLAVRGILWIAVVGSLIVMLMQAPGLVFLVARAIYRRPLMSHSWGLAQPLQLVVYWPSVYLMARVVEQRLGSRPQGDGVVTSS